MRSENFSVRGRRFYRNRKSLLSLKRCAAQPAAPDWRAVGIRGAVSGILSPLRGFAVRHPNPAFATQNDF
jgi:hypothetical protein